MLFTLCIGLQAQEPNSIDPSKKVIAKPKILSMEKAKYTDEARSHGVHGTVVLSCLFGEIGKIIEISVIKGLPYGLTENAKAAALKIKFLPATENGEPVSTRMSIEFTFNLFAIDVDSIPLVLSYDFPFVTDKTAKILAKDFCKKTKETNDVLRWTIQCEGAGAKLLPPSELEEFLSLMNAGISALPPNEKILYEILLIKQQNGSLTSNDLERAFDYKNRGLGNLPEEKKKRFIELHNKAILLGFAEFTKRK